MDVRVGPAGWVDCFWHLFRHTGLHSGYVRRQAGELARAFSKLDLVRVHVGASHSTDTWIYTPLFTRSARLVGVLSDSYSGFGFFFKRGAWALRRHFNSFVRIAHAFAR